MGRVLILFCIFVKQPLTSNSAYPVASLGYAGWMLRHWGYKPVYIFGLCTYAIGALMMYVLTPSPLPPFPPPDLSHHKHHFTPPPPTSS